ncbi:Hpt domain-containing protein [Salinihabitans flavidus]|uniref:Hpt domain-containing protein n=1 Tax=Salinihabitans flavidus TaxID=569882 RepID=A0A1H8VTB4_9RHOB|nr:Hpt domain-containing protein [Salinihabitans flavidus]SEP18672.1 Hpt domain-containing protein [Salinihabitans flavidus]
MKGVQDPDAFREACAVFGDEGALARLRTFRGDLAAHLSWIGQGQPDHADLRDVAHRTAGRAGFLGFSALAEASAQLDEATRRNRGIAAALDRWAEQARIVAEIPPEEMDRDAP